jgi:Ca-activated chloride channel homolog
VRVVLEPTTGSELPRIMAAVDELSAGGGTAGGAGLQTAYALAERNYDPTAINRIILATDGDFNVGESDPRKLEQFVSTKRKAGIYLTVVGVGRDNLNDALMQRLAHAGNGQAAYLDSMLEARKVFVEELGSTMAPIADDVKMQIEFNPASVAEYRLIGHETRKLHRADFLDDAVAGGQVGAGHNLTAIYEVVPKGSNVHHMEPLRYGNGDKVARVKQDVSNELAFARLRYRLPGRQESQTLELAVSARGAGTLEEASDDVRFSVAVAGFAQLLRQEKTTGTWSYDHAAALADGARGEDSFGWRSELVQLIRTAGGIGR